MSQKTENLANDPTIMGNEKPRRDPDGKDGRDAREEDRRSERTDQSDRMTKSGRLDPADLKQVTDGPDVPRKPGVN